MERGNGQRSPRKFRSEFVVASAPDGTRGTGFFTNWAEQSTRAPEWIAKTNKAYGIDRPAP